MCSPPPRHASGILSARILSGPARTGGTENRREHYLLRRAVAVSRLFPVQEDQMKKLLAILALSSALVVTAACNTVRGAGRDAQSAANAVDNAM
jgi:predicted small secreted protein